MSTDGVHFTVLAPVYTRTIPFEDGSVRTMARRERPQVYWKDACHGVLVTAVEPDASSDASFVVATPIGPTSPAP